MNTRSTPPAPDTETEVARCDFCLEWFPDDELRGTDAGIDMCESCFEHRGFLYNYDFDV